MLDHYSFPGLRSFCILTLLSTPAFAADAPAAAKTGDVDLTFTARSPQSDPKDLAKRLSLKAAEMAEDYDLSSKPFKAYVPTNYDPATPHAVFVYLGYKDSPGTPPEWHDVQEKSHLIFITPVSHTGTHYDPSIPLWHTLGLAFDAVHNLKQSYNVDPNRIYLMTIGENATQLALVSADVFTGFVVAADPGYFRRITLPNRHYIPPAFPAPTDPWRSAAHARPYVLLDAGADNPENKAIPLKAAAMRQDGFKLVTTFPASLNDDLHYPNFKVGWFERDALPYLDKSATAAPATEPAKPAPAAAAKPAEPSTKPAAASPAARALAVAELYIKNGKPDIARTKLQQVIDTYPTDPAAEKVKELLKKLQ
jgi:hypothetical protein